MAKLLMERFFFLMSYLFSKKASNNPPNLKYSLFLPKISKNTRFSLEIFLHVSKIAVFHMILQCEVYVKLILKKSKAIQKNPLHQKFRHNISCIFLHLYIYFSILYGGVVFPLKSWIHIIRPNSVLFTFSFILGFPLKSKIDQNHPKTPKNLTPSKKNWQWDFHLKSRWRRTTI